jgi:Ca2+-binding RTX toxin-like protein
MTISLSSEFSSIILANPANSTTVGSADNDYILGTTGSGFIDGGDGSDVIDYSLLNVPISLKATGIIDKGSAGVDDITAIETIIAPANQFNLVDATTPPDSNVSMIIDLALNTLLVDGIPGAGTLSRTVVNFTDVIGTSQADIIFGDGQSNILIGGDGGDFIFGDTNDDLLLGEAGSDFLVGGDGNDILSGYGFTSGEFDSLVGGSGSDLFILGDALGSYYLGEGYAVIADFNPAEGDLIQVFGSASNYSLSFQSFTSADRVDTLIFLGNDLISVVEGTTDVIPALDFVSA